MSCMVTVNLSQDCQATVHSSAVATCKLARYLARTSFWSQDEMRHIAGAPKHCRHGLMRALSAKGVITMGIWTQSPEAGQRLCQSYARGRALVLEKTLAFCSIQVRRSLEMPDLSSLARVVPSQCCDGRYSTDHVSNMSPAHWRLPRTLNSRSFAGGKVVRCR